MNKLLRVREIGAFLNGPTLDERQKARRQSKLRLFILLVLFDILFLAAVLLSFQEKEYIEHIEHLERTREVIVTVIIEQTVTSTRVVTEIVPYGAAE